MSFADRVEQQRSGQGEGQDYTPEVARRHRELAMQNDIYARSDARERGFDPLTREYYKVALTWLANDAALRQALAEAQADRWMRRCAYLESRLLQRSDPASRGMSANQDADSFPPRLVGSDKNAHSHHERGKR